MIDSMKEPATIVPTSIADGIERSQDSRIVALDRTMGRILTGVVALGSLVGVFGLSAFLIGSAFSGVLPAWTAAVLEVLLVLAWCGGVGLVAWWFHRWPEVAYRHARYTVDEHGIEIRTGVWWRTVITVPRSRVQHTDVSQGPLERRHELSTVVIYTAGTHHAKVSLRGVDHATALRIRDHLLPRERHDGV
jgi:membrane protein YdbS with pleckstrin-like domain